nr:pentatricopeptide repeat-containing protein [Tanacetum cinerariifolium]
MFNSDEFPDDDEMFLEIDEVVFKIHTKGYFEYNPLRYVNGSIHCVSSFTYDKDVFQQCLNHIMFEIDEPKWALFYRKPKQLLEKGLKLLHTNNDVYSLINASIRNGSINLYVAHKKQNLGKYYYKNMKWEEEDDGLRCSNLTPFLTRVKTKIRKRKKTSVIHDEGDDRKKSLVTEGRKGNEKVIEDEGIRSKGNKADVTIYKRAMVNGKAKMIEDVGAVKRGKDRGVVIKDGGFINDGEKETVVTKRDIGSRKTEGKRVTMKLSLKFIPKDILNIILLDEPKWALFYRKPKQLLEKGLKLLHTNNDVYSLINASIRNGSINLYVAHKKQNLGKYYYKNMKWEEEDDGLRCSSLTPFSTRVKTKIRKRKKTSVIHDEGDDRKKSLVTEGRKGNEKVIEDEGIRSKGNKADVTIYKRAMVNGKAKMIEDVGAVKRGKDRGVVIKDGGFINDGEKETVVTKRDIGSRKTEGKRVTVESE